MYKVKFFSGYEGKNFIGLSPEEVIRNMPDFEVTYFDDYGKKDEELRRDISKDIIKSINGLYGFIGIDYIISKNEIYFVEINSRITTPYIVLHNIVNVNLTQTIIELLLADKKREITINNNGTFYK